MERRPSVTDNGSWSRVLGLYERGDTLFVDEIRRITDAERLAIFASAWCADPRPAARHLLFLYLDQPLNAFRHEALIKSLFRFAERSFDDELLARFLVLFDRSIRRRITSRQRKATAPVATFDEAEALRAAWEEAGFEVDLAPPHGERAHYLVSRTWTVECVRVPKGTVMPRPKGRHRQGPFPVRSEEQEAWAGKQLFGVATRGYLRRRTWRYFRKLGQQHPQRYLAAAFLALTLYRDEDVENGLAFLDNWGLIHLLYHGSPILVAQRRGWRLAPGRRLAELEPAPAFEEPWRGADELLLRLHQQARCRPVRLWALHVLLRAHSTLKSSMKVELALDLLADAEPSSVMSSLELLRSQGDFPSAEIPRLLTLVQKSSKAIEEPLCVYLEETLDPKRISWTDALTLAKSSGERLARIGLRWIKAFSLTCEEEGEGLRSLMACEQEDLRKERVEVAIDLFRHASVFRSEWALDCLESPHSGIRTAGLTWFQNDERLGRSVVVWNRLLESPYAEVRAVLAERMKAWKAVPEGIDRLRIRSYWAKVLGESKRSRARALVTAQVLKRFAEDPSEKEALIPLLAAALREGQGPTWQTALAGLTRLAVQYPDLGPVFEASFSNWKIC